MDIELELSSKVARLNELRSKQLSNIDLTDDELKEGISLIAKIREIKSGKNSKARGEKAAAAGKNIMDMF